MRDIAQMLSDDMDEVLSEYYRWSNVNNPADIGYPHADTLSRLRGPSRGASISDDEAMWIDYALTCLKKDDPEQYKVIKRVYRDRKSLRWLEKRGEGSRNTLGRNLANGLQFVSGVLHGVQQINGTSTSQRSNH